MKTGKIIVVALVSFLFTAINGICSDSLIVQENGNVGIGTLQPTATLEVETLNTPDNTTSLLINQHDPDQWAQEVSSNGSGLTVGLRTGSSGVPFQVTHSDVGTLLRVISSGNVGIGTPSPDSKLKVTQNANSPALKIDLPITGLTSPAFQIIYDGTESSAPLFDIKSGSPKADRFWIGANGNVGINTTSPSYKLDVNGTIRGDNVSPSDARWKTNVTTLENSLDKVSELRGVRYEWIDHSKGTGDHIGFIAQEVEAVFPEAVSTDNQGYKSVSYAKLVSPLVEAVKTLRTENDRLKQDNDAIRQELAEIKAMLKGLQ